jgi:type VI secretion system protein ImpM
VNEDFLHSVPVPGWYGKLPGMGDLDHRRLPDAFRKPWSRWLQAGLGRLRMRHEDWADRYLQAPRWCFVLGDNLIDGRCWVGVLMPSVDGAGRYFPFTVAAEFVSSRSELQGDALARTQQWWALAARAALEGLAGELDAERFDELLQRLFASAAVASADEDGGTPLALPVIGHSLWFTDPAAEGGLGMTSQGLPEDDQFEALFGFGAGAQAPESEAM